MKQLSLLPNYKRTVHFSYPGKWLQFIAADLTNIRRVDAYFPCPDGCPYDCHGHFMITDDHHEYTKLCTLDIIKYKPFEFDHERVFEFF